MLLDLKRYSDGHFEATLLGERAEADGSNVVRFDSGYDAQQFTSAWYGTPEMRAQIYPKPVEMVEIITPELTPEHIREAERWVTTKDDETGVTLTRLNRAERRKLRLGKA